MSALHSHRLAVVDYRLSYKFVAMTPVHCRMSPLIVMIGFFPVDLHSCVRIRILADDRITVQEHVFEWNLVMFGIYVGMVFLWTYRIWAR